MPPLRGRRPPTGNSGSATEIFRNVAASGIGVSFPTWWAAPYGKSWIRPCCIVGFSFSLSGGEGKLARPFDHVEYYDPVMDQWSEVRSLPEPRADHASCVCNNLVYVCGGRADTQKGVYATNFWSVVILGFPKFLLAYQYIFLVYPLHNPHLIFGVRRTTM